MSTVKRIPLIFLGGLTVLLFLLPVLLLFTVKKDEAIKKLSVDTYSVFEEYIAPVIMHDPTPFEDVSDAPQEELIRITVWSILQNEKESEIHEYKKGSIILPQSKVEEKFKSLFGKKMWFSHFSVDGGGIDFTYSEVQKAYIIPLAGVTPTYTPRVTEAYEKRNNIILTVAYLDSQAWLQDSEGNTVEPEPSELVKIILTKTDEDTFVINSIKKTEE